MNIVDFLTVRKVFPTASIVRRMINQGAVTLNGKPATTIDQLKNDDRIVVKQGSSEIFFDYIRNE